MWSISVNSNSSDLFVIIHVPSVVTVFVHSHCNSICEVFLCETKCMHSGIFHQSIASVHFPSPHSIISRVESEDVFPLEESEFPSSKVHSYDILAITGAPSLVGYEDDCSISYTVTIVDVRSCTRCTRVPVGQLSSDKHQGMICIIIIITISKSTAFK